MTVQPQHVPADETLGTLEPVAHFDGALLCLSWLASFSTSSLASSGTSRAP